MYTRRLLRMLEASAGLLAWNAVAATTGSAWAESYARALKIEELAGAFYEATKAQPLMRYDADY